MKSWYLDAFDPLAGFAFASHRDMIRDDWTLEEASATVYLSPPYFVPEPVSSRGTALAATRGSLQAGFFLDGTEYAFGSIDEVRDFVRRFYNGGGGGPAGGGVANDFPLPPDGSDGGEAARQFDLEGSTADRFIASCKAFAENVERATRDESPIKMQWNLASVGSTEDHANASLFLPAGLYLLEELWRHRPTQTRAKPDRWFAMWTGLLSLLYRLGLPELEIYHLLTSLGALVDVPRFRQVTYINRVTLTIDPFETIRYLPLPSRISQSIRSLVADARVDGVGSLLALVFSSPQVIAQLYWEQSAVAAIVLFAAACIVSVDFSSVAFATVEDLSTTESVEVMRSRQAGIVLSAAKWCERALPRYAFPEKVERQIARASTLLYA